MFSVSIILNEGTNSADSVGRIQFNCVGLEPNGVRQLRLAHKLPEPVLFFTG